MSAVAGKTAESNWLTFFEETQSYRGDFVTGNACRALELVNSKFSINICLY